MDKYRVKIETFQDCIIVDDTGQEVIDGYFDEYEANQIAKAMNKAYDEGFDRGHGCGVNVMLY